LSIIPLFWPIIGAQKRMIEVAIVMMNGGIFSLAKLRRRRRLTAAQFLVNIVERGDGIRECLCRLRAIAHFKDVGDFGFKIRPALDHREIEF
ncbi:MAG: hypothetical protein ACTS5I_05185, partial [Rhodanobacter sp.]